MKFDPELVFSEHDPRTAMHKSCSRCVLHRSIEISSSRPGPLGASSGHRGATDPSYQTLGHRGATMPTRVTECGSPHVPTLLARPLSAALRRLDHSEDARIRVKTYHEPHNIGSTMPTEGAVSDPIAALHPNGRLSFYCDLTSATPFRHSPSSNYFGARVPKPLPKARE